MTDSLRLINGLVLPDADQPARLADLLIIDGCIREIGMPGQFDRLETARTIDACDRLVIPGLVNGHTHAHGALGRGRCLMSRLRVIWPRRRRSTVIAAWTTWP